MYLRQRFLCGNTDQPLITLFEGNFLSVLVCHHISRIIKQRQINIIFRRSLRYFQIRRKLRISSAKFRHFHLTSLVCREGSTQSILCTRCRPGQIKFIHFTCHFTKTLRNRFCPDAGIQIIAGTQYHHSHDGKHGVSGLFLFLRRKLSRKKLVQSNRRRNRPKERCHRQKPPCILHGMEHASDTRTQDCLPRKIYGRKKQCHKSEHKASCPDFT